MRIAFINVTPGGSTGKIMSSTAEAAAECGHECVIFYGRGEAEQTKNDGSEETVKSNENTQNRETTENPVKKIKIEGKFDVLAHAFKARFLGRNGHGSKKATKRLVQNLKNFDPDVIQLHNIHGYYINIEILFDYLRNTRAKIYWTLHDCWTFTGGCAHFTAAKCEKWKTGCEKCQYRNVYPKSYPDTTKKEYEIKKNVFTGLTNLTLVTPCEWLKGLVKKSFLRDYECDCIPNGIDLNVFRGAQDEETEADKRVALPGKYILGVSSVWDERKRPQMFIETAKILKKDGFSAVMIGKTDKTTQEAAKEAGNILLFDRTENFGMLAEMYKNAVCLVSTSVEDTFPTIGLESMACGTPVVYADVCGCPEQVEGDPVTGLVATPDDPNSFADAVRIIEKDARTFKENCEVKSKTKLSQEKMCERYLELYEREYQ